MSELTLTDRFETIFQASEDRNAGKLKDFQATAFKAYKEAGLPERKTEAYKYTPISRVLDKNFGEISVAETHTEWTQEECLSKLVKSEDANHLIFINGKFYPEFSIIKSATNDLNITTINDSDLELLGQIQPKKQAADAFACLNSAVFANGLSLISKKNKENIPVYIYQFIDSKAAYIFPRILIKSETGSTLNVYEKTFVKGDSPIFINSILEAQVEANGEARFTKLQNYDKNLYTVEGIYASQARDSRFYTNTYSFSGALIRNNISIDIDGENCEGHMNGLYLLSGKTHVDNNTSVDHKMPNSFSNELYKGVLDENSRGVFNGKIYVRPDAQKTNAFQSNNNILLSEAAVINTKPQLEIWADDVKCSHGCTSGQLDEEAIFYLRSRGVSKVRAKAMLLNAFAVETLEEVKSEEIKSEIEEIILHKLG